MPICLDSEVCTFSYCAQQCLSKQRRGRKCNALLVGPPSAFADEEEAEKEEGEYKVFKLGESTPEVLDTSTTYAAC